MVDYNGTLERIVDTGVIAVLRGVDEEQIVPVAEAIYQGGVGGIEITADGTRASEQIAAVDRALEGTDAVVGAGTVFDAATAQSVIDAGAEFVFAPNLDREVIATCHRLGAVAAPGVMTPSEAVQAVEAGADVLKMFPASTVGPGHLSSLRGPLGELPIIPTGGVTTENVGEYFDAGAIAVGAGSALIDYEAIEADDMAQVQESAAAFVDAVEAVR